LLWVLALWPVDGSWRNRLLSGAVLLAILVQSTWLILNFQQLYQVGVTHLQEAVAVMAQADGRYLFVNFPDRYSPKRMPYPVGYWGLTLAPVVTDLADFVPGAAGRDKVSASRSLPWLDADARANGPFDIDMRGVIVTPAELAALAAGQDAVLVSRYGVDGRFALEPAGSLSPGVAMPCQLALFAGIVCLHALQVDHNGQRLDISLTWSTDQPLPPGVTIFVHWGPAGQPPLVQDDGDSWRGLLPLADWPPGDLVHEWRSLVLPADGAGAVLRLGLYDRVTGERWTAVALDAPGERPLADNAYAVQP
jgi:hypothetical protein